MLVESVYLCTMNEEITTQETVAVPDPKKQKEIEAFKYTVYMWEIVITAILIGASYFVLKAFKKNKAAAEVKNKKYYSGSAE